MGSFGLLLACCLTAQWLIRTVYEEWEYGQLLDQRIAKRRGPAIALPFWSYWDKESHRWHFYVLAKNERDAVDILIQQSTFEKVSNMEQDHI